jgi:hypothetical protein
MAFQAVLPRRDAMMYTMESTKTPELDELSSNSRLVELEVLLLSTSRANGVAPQESSKIYAANDAYVGEESPSKYAVMALDRTHWTLLCRGKARCKPEGSSGTRRTILKMRAAREQGRRAEGD